MTGRLSDEAQGAARLPRTAFKPGQSSNPRGGAPGTLNKVTHDAREAAQRLVDDPEDREALRTRMQQLPRWCSLNLGSGRDE